MIYTIWIYKHYEHSVFN